MIEDGDEVGSWGLVIAVAAVFVTLLLTLGGCTSSRITRYDLSGNVVEVEESKEFLKYRAEVNNVRGGDMSGFRLRLPIPFTTESLLELDVGAGTAVNAPKDADFRVCQNLQLDANGSPITAARCVEVNQLSEEPESPGLLGRILGR